MEVHTGKEVRGYQLHERIGAGGFGAVYRAYQPLVKRDVAIKIILPQFANQPEFIRSFEIEAQLVARLEHLHIVPLYDYWREPNGAYLVMRWLRGGSLRNLLMHGPLPLEDASKLLDQVAGALTVAHRRGVVHRDIKPDNILLDEEQNVYLTDFGIAQDLEANHTTRGGDTFAGSLTYTSPEQIKGERSTPLTDIYSLGVLLYEIICGEHPFPQAAPPQLVFKHLSEPLPSVLERFPDMPPEVDTVIQRATAKAPAERFNDALEMARALRRAARAARHQTPFLHDDLGVGEAPPIIDTTPTGRIPLPDVETPYKGLRPFQTVDADEFFGREQLVNRLVRRLADYTDEPRARILAVVGPSGSGKSSVVKAGLIPALHRGDVPGSENWFTVELVPGHDPFAEIESALLSQAVTPPDEGLMALMLNDSNGLGEAVKRVLPADESSQLVLFFDQFEEVFTLLDDENQRVHLFDSLSAAIADPDSRLFVIFTLRADLYDRPLMYPRFGELMRKRTEVVLPLKPEELERAIVEPAAQVGVSLEPGLIAAIVADVSEQPGALPLLQYALTELFERRQGRVLTLDAYEQIGGVLGALARRAEELFSALTRSQQQAARQLFLRLVVTDENGTTARRRVLRNELLSVDVAEEAMASVIDQFGKYRLLTFDRDPVTRGPTVEIAHEALLREWQRLRYWLDENREDLRLHQRLTAATDEWINAGYDPSFLVRGSRLDQFETWLETTIVALTDDEESYLQASIEARESRLAQEAAQREREALLERRSRNRLRSLAAVLLVATVGALGLMAYALNQSNIAQTQAVIAENNATEARGLALATSARLALQDGNSDLAVLLALEANRLARSTLAQLALAEVAYAPGTQRLLDEHDAGVTDVAISPDNTRVVSAARDGTVLVWDVASGTVQQRLTGHDDRVTALDFSPDGQMIVTASMDTTARIWDIASGRELQRLDGHVDGVLDVHFSPGGRNIVTASNDRSLILWNVVDGSERFRLTGHEAAVTNVTFSPDSQLIASGALDRTVRIWNVLTGRELEVLHGHEDRVTALAFSPDSNTVASGSANSTIWLWNLVTTEGPRRLTGHTDGVSGLAFADNGRKLVSTSWDTSMILWDLEANQISQRFIGHDAPVMSLALSRDESLAVSGSEDHDVRIWSLNSSAEVRRLRFYIDEVTRVALSPDGTRAVAGGDSANFVLWDVVAGTQVGRFFGHEGSILSLAFSPDGASVMSSSTADELFVWDAATQTRLHELNGHDNLVASIAFHPTEPIAVTGSWDRTMIAWDVVTGEIIHRYTGSHEDRILAVAVTPDGTRILSGSNSGDVSLWDFDAGTELRRYDGINSAVTEIQVNPDGQSFLAASIDGVIYMYDLSSTDPVRRFEGHRGGVLGVDISADGTTAISASRDQTLILWDIASGEQIYRFEGHEDAVTTVQFTPDGRWAISGSRDRTVREWRTLAFNQLVAWTRANRHVPQLDCTRRLYARIDALCGGAAGQPTPSSE